MANTYPDKVDMKKTVEQLKSFCRGEISAVETYTTALTSPSLQQYADTLRSCQASHQQRVSLLSQEIQRLGGEVPDSAGPWGALVDTIEHAAVGLGAKTAIAALEEGEDHGLKDYRSDVDKLDPTERSFVETRIVPAQLESHRLMSTLKHSLS